MRFHSDMLRTLAIILQPKLIHSHRYTITCSHLHVTSYLTVLHVYMKYRERWGKVEGSGRVQEGGREVGSRWKGAGGGRRVLKRH